MLTLRRRSREPWKRTAWTYRRHALTHYAQTAVAVVPIAVGIFTMSIAAAILFVIAGEGLILVLLPRLPGFRRQVDASLDRAACLCAASARVALLARMSEEHRRELEQLEELVARLRVMRGVDRGTSEEWLGLDGLLAMFVRLSIVQRESASAFHPAGDVQLDVQIADLERTRSGATGPAAVWAARRLAILRDRRETWRRAREERAVLAEQLATIGELVRWTYEEAARGKSIDASSDVADAIAQCAKNGPVLRELTALVGPDHVDPETLRLGRYAMTELETERVMHGLPADGTKPGIRARVSEQPTAQVRVEHAPSPEHDPRAHLTTPSHCLGAASAAE